EPEAGPPVEGEVELGVAPAPEPLERRLALAPRRALPPLDDGDVRRQERAPGLTDEVERPLGILPEVVEEDAADAAGLLAVREVEVLVAPRLEAAVVGHAG